MIVVSSLKTRQQAHVLREQADKHAWVGANKLETRSWGPKLRAGSASIDLKLPDTVKELASTHTHLTHSMYVNKNKLELFYLKASTA